MLFPMIISELNVCSEFFHFFPDDNVIPVMHLIPLSFLILLWAIFQVSVPTCEVRDCAKCTRENPGPEVHTHKSSLHFTSAEITGVLAIILGPCNHCPKNRKPTYHTTTIFCSDCQAQIHSLPSLRKAYWKLYI